MKFTGPEPTGVYLWLLLYDLFADQEGIRIQGTIETEDGQEVSFDTGDRKEMQALMRRWRTREPSCGA